MTNISSIDDIVPHAVMSEDELKRWESLPPDLQLARLRQAIRDGIDSGSTMLSMDDIWADAQVRHAEAKL